MVNKYRLIGKVLMLSVIFTLAGLNITDWTITKKSLDVSIMDMNKKNLQLISAKKYSNVSINTSIRYIGHRGIGGLAPENTLPAFELAGKLGFWGAECDVRTTIDGNWMVLHDDTVDRMTDGNGKIQNLTFEKLQTLNIDSGIKIAQYKVLKIPKLEDYLLICKKWGLTPVIEMKSANNLQYYDKFIDTIKKYEDINKTVVISLSTISLNELRKRDGQLTLGLICSDVTENTIDYVKALGNAFIDSSYYKITKNKVEMCHENNIKIGVWTVDGKDAANNLIKDGVDYLTMHFLI